MKRKKSGDIGKDARWKRGEMIDEKKVREQSESEGR